LRLQQHQRAPCLSGKPPLWAPSLPPNAPIPTPAPHPQQDKLSALIDRAAFVPSALSGASLEVRDISTNAAWQDEMHLSVPVLVALNERDEEVRWVGWVGVQCSAVQCSAVQCSAVQPHSPSQVAHAHWPSIQPPAFNPHTSHAQVPLPRPQPRVTADRLEKHLEAALREAGLL